jgi:phospholipid N-methyltransferase
MTMFRSVSARYYGPCHGVSTQIRVSSGYRNDSFSHIETLQNFLDIILKQLPAFPIRQLERAAYPGKDFAQAFKQPTDVRGIED